MNRPVSTLPEYFALKSKSNGKYLKYRRDDPKARAVLQFSGDELVDVLVKFFSDGVTGHDGGSSTTYHLRCCYNKKYWQKASQGESLIIGGGDTPDDNSTKWSCTLFRPEFQEEGVARLVHVQSGGYLGRGSSDPAAGPDCLIVVAAAERAEVCEVVNYREAVVTLPKLVAFKGDNGKYLKASHIKPIIMQGGMLKMNAPTYKTLQFTGEKLSDPSVSHEVFVNPADATISIKSGSGGDKGFWRRNEYVENRIFLVESESDRPDFHDKETLFKVHRLHPSEPLYGLTSCGANNMPCKRVDHPTYRHCLRAQDVDVEPYNKLLVEEPIVWRRMYEADFKTADARVYPVEQPKVEVLIHPNETTQVSKVKVQVGKTESHATSWSNSYGWKIGGSVELTTDFTGIPLVKEAKVVVSGEHSEEKTEGGSQEESKSSAVEVEIPVPPKKQLRITTTVTKTACDVPFDYSYTEMRHDGTTADLRVQDGLFTTTTSTTVVATKEEELGTK
ncbi:unnamed protein product [Linum trigynum]|uniref:Agglutinin domain-containing protein n=1 Tax=Linum trigynum TaxID=586398 RepID=A0AAV2CRF6_9ROSI